jgi:hypothetical protein
MKDGVEGVHGEFPRARFRIEHRELTGLFDVLFRRYLEHRWSIGDHSGVVGVYHLGAMGVALLNGGRV